MSERLTNEPLKVAIIGAGFAGLSLAWHLLSSKQVTCRVFDEAGIGQGASGIASGLLHPFPAAASNYSFMGKEALHESICLLRIAQQYSKDKIADESGILKLALTDEEKRSYSALSRRYMGLKWLGTNLVQTQGIKKAPALLIQQGITVFCAPYLQALWKACEELGGKLSIESVADPKQLTGYDVIVMCCGASIQKFDPSLKVQLIKGQILTCKTPYPLSERSIIAKGYIAKTKDPLIYNIGSTYEHHYKEVASCIDIAKKLIFDQCASYIECIQEIKVLQCHAGIRVSYPKTHLPVIKKYKKGLYALTAFGSRGLLYHGLLGKQLAESILYEEDARISREFFLLQDYT